MKNRIMLLAALFSLAACNVVDPDTETDLGAVFFFTNPVFITVPDTVSAGQPFEVTVRTYGDGCVSFARTEVEVDGLTAEIRPYDRRETDRPCEEILKTIAHTVTLRFNTRGTARIRVIGTRMPGNQSESVERTVVVT